MRLGQEFDPRCNALNAWRLALATGVIVWHSFPLTGHQMDFAPARHLLSDGFVDGFFAVSGFLITASWLNNPRPRAYFAARALRILPGLWACLIVTAFVIAPIGVAIQGGSAAALLLSTEPFEYVIKNSAVAWVQPGIGDTPNGIPWPHMWDGSLWTLLWEVFCYIGVAIVGVTALRRRRWFVPAALVLALVCGALLPPLSRYEGVPPSEQQDIDPTTGMLVLAAIAARFATMFLAGALLYQLRNVIPARWSLVAVSAGVVAASSVLANYRLLGAVALAYMIIASGVLIHSERLRLRTDVSYGVYIYAFPIQQVLVMYGLGRLVHPLIFAVVAAAITLPLAFASWFFVEKPALQLKSRFKRATPPVSPDPRIDSSTSPPSTAETESEIKRSEGQR